VTCGHADDFPICNVERRRGWPGVTPAAILIGAAADAAISRLTSIKLHSFGRIPKKLAGRQNHK
jgi:hypothetical protein